MGWRATRAEKSLDAGIAEVCQRLAPDSTGGAGEGEADATAAADAPVALVVSAACEHLTREFLGYKETHVGTTAADDHALDALRYAVTTDVTQARQTIPSVWR